MAKKEKIKEKGEFPSIFRRITENQSFMQIFHVLGKMALIFAFVSIFVFVMFVLTDLYRNFVKYQRINYQRQKLASEISVLKSFSQSYKNSKEVYLQIAVREYELGNFKSAEDYLQKALFIDPNYDEALKLQKDLVGK